MLTQKELVSTSKFLSYVLRHNPMAISLTLDEHGWASIEQLIILANARGRRLTREIVDEVVLRNDKKRFVVSDDGSCIRAAQGHSIKVDLQLEPRRPPEILFHGTAVTAVDSILQRGLNSRSRNHVHLSSDEQTAEKVGQRHGKPAVLRIRAGDMWRAGHVFYLSENGVWLVDAVPCEFIEALST